jgi:hypothetical protein
LSSDKDKSLSLLKQITTPPSLLVNPGLDICPPPRIENVAPRMRTVRRVLETSDVLSGVTITVGLKKKLVDVDIGGQLFDFPALP